MIIINDPDQLNIEEKTAVALGNFDGIHIGHQKIMQKALDAAKAEGLRSLCFTFANHPFNYIMDRDASDPAAIKLICSEEEKIALIEDMGFDILLNMPFDERIMTMRAHDFFEDILRKDLNAGFISVGFNYSYGARAEGKPEMLREECSKTGIGISVHDAVTLGGKVVSSTLIREMISEGNMEMAAEYLGRPVCFEGIVEHGKHLGTSNGFPTANIVVEPDRMAPPSGVYFSRVEIAGDADSAAVTAGAGPSGTETGSTDTTGTKAAGAVSKKAEYCAVSNIGFKPTVQDDTTVRTVETNIFDFTGDIYGKSIKVYFDHFSRGEVKFGSKEELFAQIARDSANAAAYYAGRS